jgi:hypothetical protein
MLLRMFLINSTLYYLQMTEIYLYLIQMQMISLPQWILGLFFLFIGWRSTVF